MMKKMMKMVSLILAMVMLLACRSLRLPSRMPAATGPSCSNLCRQRRECCFPKKQAGVFPAYDR